MLLDAQVLGRQRVIIERPLRVLLKRLQIQVQLLSRRPKCLDIIVGVNLEERCALACDFGPILHYLLVRWGVSYHRGVSTQRLCGLVKDGLSEDADIDADVAG